MKSTVLLSLLTLAAITPSGAASAQQPSVPALAERSPVVVRGKVLRINASDEPLLGKSARSVIITVQRMFAGREIAGDQQGRQATVILSRPEAVKPGEEAIFFGRVLFLGRTMTIADDGELPAGAADSTLTSALETGVQAQNDRPIRERLAAAALVFRGTVDSVRALEAGPDQSRRPEPTSEHDPEWRVATVHLVTPLRGGTAGQTITMVFAASRDITWFRAPKLEPGQDAVFLAHTPSPQEEPLLRASGLGPLMDKGTLYLVTEPYDVLQPSEEPRVRRLLSARQEK